MIMISPLHFSFLFLLFLIRPFIRSNRSKPPVFPVFVQGVKGVNFIVEKKKIAHRYATLYNLFEASLPGTDCARTIQRDLFPSTFSCRSTISTYDTMGMRRNNGGIRSNTTDNLHVLCLEAAF